MTAQRFAHHTTPAPAGNPNVVRGPFGPAGPSVKDKYLRDWKAVKRARFNAAKRFERRQNASVMAFAVAGVFGFLVPYFVLLFGDMLSPRTANILTFTAYVTGALSLILALIEQAKNHPVRVERFDICGRRVNSILRRLAMTHLSSDQDLLPFIRDYEWALDQCVDNHDEIDYRIALAQEDLRPAAPGAPAAEPATLKTLRRKETLQIYLVYIVTWALPLVLGLLLWLLL